MNTLKIIQKNGEVTKFQSRTKHLEMDIKNGDVTIRYLWNVANSESPSTKKTPKAKTKETDVGTEYFFPSGSYSMLEKINGSDGNIEQITVWQ